MDNKEIFKKLDNYFIFVLSVLLFSGITVYFVTRSNYRISFSVGNAEVKLSVILLITVSLFLMKFFEGRIKNSATEGTEKILRFRTLTYFRLSLLLLTNLIILVIYNISGEGLLLLIYLLIFSLCFAYRPLEKKFKAESESFK